MGDVRVRKERRDRPKNLRADTFKRVAGGQRSRIARNKNYTHTSIEAISRNSGKTPELVLAPPGERNKLIYYFKTWTNKNTCQYLQHTKLTYITHRHLKIINLCQYSSDCNWILIINEGIVNSRVIKNHRQITKHTIASSWRNKADCLCPNWQANY